MRIGQTSRRIVGWVKPTRIPQISGLAMTPKRGFHPPYGLLPCAPLLILLLVGVFAIMLQPQPLNATPPGILDFKRTDRVQFEHFKRLCEFTRSRQSEISILETAHFNLYQIKNQCITGKRAKVCKTFAINKITRKCSANFYISNSGYYEDNENYTFPPELNGDYGLNPPIVFEAETGTILLFSNQKKMIAKSVE